jgi:hypothetical protein
MDGYQLGSDIQEMKALLRRLVGREAATPQPQAPTRGTRCCATYLSSRAVREGSEPAPAEARVSEYSLTWQDAWQAGDCEMAAGFSLTFRTNGTGRFSCRVMTHSTHSWDMWHQQFIVKNAAGAVLFHLPEIPPGHSIDDNEAFWSGPRMESPPHGGWYDWNVDFAYPEVFYSTISTSTKPRGKC